MPAIIRSGSGKGIEQAITAKGGTERRRCTAVADGRREKTQRTIHAEVAAHAENRSRGK